MQNASLRICVRTCACRNTGFHQQKEKGREKERKRKRECRAEAHAGKVSP